MFKRLKMFKKGGKPSRPFTQKKEIIYNQPDEHEQNKLAEFTAAERTIYLFPASIKDIGGNKWGYMNTKGKFVLPPIYDRAGEFQENGLAIVHLQDLAGVIDINGYYIVQPQYHTIHPFSEGRAAVLNHRGYKVIDESGKELTSKVYSYIGEYKDGRVLFADQDKAGNHLYGYLNRRGKEVIPAAYESATDFCGGKAVVKIKDGPCALINLTGKVLQTYPYWFVGSYGKGLMVFQKRKEDKFGYIDDHGQILITPRFTDAKPFEECRAIVSENGRYGLIDRKGQYILKPNYHHILNLGEDRIAIGKAINPDKPLLGDIYAVADLSGHILTGFIYNGITKYDGGKASAFNEKATFFIDKNGNKIEDLLIVNGNGILLPDKKLIKADIDSRLFYYKKNGSLVWKQNTEIQLNNQYTVIEEKYKPNKDFLIYYPQLNGMMDKKTQTKINQALKDLAGLKETSPHLQLESNYRGDFEIPFYKKDLVVMELTGYDGRFRGDHSVSVRKYVHIDLKTGEIFYLKDLFKPGSQYVRVISEIIGNQIVNNRKYSDVFSESYKGIQADQSFFINRGCLNIYFPPYEKNPTMEGLLIFSVPFEELHAIIDPSGSFWNAFN